MTDGGASFATEEYGTGCDGYTPPAQAARQHVSMSSHQNLNWLIVAPAAGCASARCARRAGALAAALVVMLSLALASAEGDAHHPPEQPRYTTVAEFARITEGFSVLSDVMRGADIARAFEGDGPFLLVAPTDEAFALLSDAELRAFLDDPARLAAFLGVHVAEDSSTSLERLGTASELSAQSIDGTRLNLTRNPNGALVVNGLTVRGAEPIRAGNGVVVVVDTLLGFGREGSR